MATTPKVVGALLELSVKRGFMSESNLNIQDSPDHLSVKQIVAFLLFYLTNHLYV